MGPFRLVKPSLAAVLHWSKPLGLELDAKIAQVYLNFVSWTDDPVTLAFVPVGSTAYCART